MSKSKNAKHFGTRWGFILASVGSAVGMANVWGFPNKMGQNGGGAFLLIYLLFVVLSGGICCGPLGRHRHPGLLCPRLALPQSQGGEGRGRPWVAAAGRVCALPSAMR